MKPLLGLFMFVGVAVNAKADVTLEFQHQATMKKTTTQEVTPVQAGQKVTINQPDPIWIEAKGRVPLLVVPAMKQSTSMKLNAPTISSWPTEVMETELDRKLSDLTIQIQEVQGMIKAQKIQQALTTTHTLKAKYPNVYFLNFLLGSVYVMAGDRGKAADAIRAGLQVHPGYKDGIEMLNSLEGKK